MGACCCAGALLACASPAGAYPDPAPVDGDVVPAPDPSLLIKPAADGVWEWQLFSTANNTARVSANRRTFVKEADAIDPKPSWWKNFNPNGNSWAPDVSFAGGKYWMYYAVSSPLSPHSAIGLATSSSGEPGTWTDAGGPILQSPAAGQDYNALDPSAFVDYAGDRWLVFGSYFGGIYVTRLDPATGRPTGAITNVAKGISTLPGAIEGAGVVKHGNAYYLFASYGDCCGSTHDTYHVRVGRATSPTGPYVDQGGVQMLQGGGTPVVESHGWVSGPGGQSVVYDPADQREKFVYHYWDTRDTATGDRRRLGINDLEWDSAGWPYLGAGARTADVEVTEMESGSEPGPGSGPVMDGWHVFAPGWVDHTFTVSDDSPYVLGVSARGRMGGGAWPILRLWLDGSLLEERTIDSVEWQLYRFDVPRLTPGQHRLRFEFLNDYFAGNLDDDRNVYIDKFTASSSVDAESMDLRTGKGDLSDGGWVLLSNGKVENVYDFSTTNRYVIRVRAKGSFAGGAWPDMKVLVDGVAVGDATVASSDWGYYDLEVPVPLGQHRIGVQFVNDYYGGSPATDRNLWVDTVSAAAVPAKCVYEGPTRPVGPNQNRC